MKKLPTVLRCGGVAKDEKLETGANFDFNRAKFARLVVSGALPKSLRAPSHKGKSAEFALRSRPLGRPILRQVRSSSLAVAVGLWTLGCSAWTGQSDKLEAPSQGGTELAAFVRPEPPVPPVPPEPVVIAPSGFESIADPLIARDEPAPVDFTAIDNIEQRKARFFAFVRPLIEAENSRLDEQHQVLERLYEQFWQRGVLGAEEQAWLEGLASEYRLGDWPVPSEEAFGQLLQRVDSLPVELALAQAAYESGWGRSRFAREGFNFFGEWCFEAGCGLVPLRRPGGANHEVAVFDSPRSSVRSYMLNLNSHPAYQRLRVLRSQQRLQGERPDGFTLAMGLRDYSELGQEYIDRLYSIMRHNQMYIASREGEIAL